MTVSNEQLLAAGFVETKFQTQGGTFFIKKLNAEDMPYVNEHIVDNDEVLGTSEVIVQVTPGREVQIYIPSADYTEPLVPVDSPEGLAILRDAGFPVDLEMKTAAGDTVTVKLAENAGTGKGKSFLTPRITEQEPHQ